MYLYVHVLHMHVHKCVTCIWMCDIDVLCIDQGIMCVCVCVCVCVCAALFRMHVNHTIFYMTSELSLESFNGICIHVML